jgi:hypothetical protein
MQALKRGASKPWGSGKGAKGQGGGHRASASDARGALAAALQQQPSVRTQGQTDVSEKEAQRQAQDDTLDADMPTDDDDPDGLAMDVTSKNPSAADGGSGRTSKERKPTQAQARATAAEQVRTAYYAEMDKIQPTTTDPRDPRYEGAMLQCARRLIAAFVHTKFMVDTGEVFNEMPHATEQAKQNASNAVQGYRYMVVCGPNFFYRPEQAGGNSVSVVAGTKPPWHDLTMQMAMNHAGILLCKTGMKETADLNRMPKEYKYGSKGKSNRTRWWVYRVAAMAASNALGKVWQRVWLGRTCRGVAACLAWHTILFHIIFRWHNMTYEGQVVGTS